MDYKEKYEQALERARQFSEKPYLEDSAGIVEYIFPELNESEDERIRKEITELVMQPTWKTEKEFHRRNELCAWLEKQGEITKEWSEMKVANIQTELQEMVDLKQKTEQGEQNPYGQRKESGDERTWIINYLSNRELNSSIIAEKENLKKAIAWLENQGEQKPEWSDEDINKIDTIIGYIASSAGEKLGILLPCINWLKSLKDRVQLKQEWSKEDEEQLSFCCAAIELSNYSSDEYRNYAISFLESLKDRYTWKPSEKQLEALESAAVNCAYSEDQDHLEDLIGQLKKLREE